MNSQTEIQSSIAEFLRIGSMYVLPAGVGNPPSDIEQIVRIAKVDKENNLATTERGVTITVHEAPQLETWGM